MEQSTLDRSPIPTKENYILKEAFNTADMKTLTELFDERVSWHTPGRTPIAGDHKGRVVGIHHNTAERGGKHVDVGCCIVFEFKDGRVIAGREHLFDLHA